MNSQPIFVYLENTDPGPVTVNLAAVTGLQWSKNSGGTWSALILAPGFPAGVVVEEREDLTRLRQALALTGSTTTQKVPKGTGYKGHVETVGQEVERRR